MLWHWHFLAVIFLNLSILSLCNEVANQLENNRKRLKLSKFAERITLTPIPNFWKPENWSAPVNRTGPVIFTAAMDNRFGDVACNSFATTLRNTGYDGDLMVALMPNSKEGFINTLIKAKAIGYVVNMTCADYKCQFAEFTQKVSSLGISIHMIRNYFYKWWAVSYAPDALIMLIDFTDVYFQSNPFTYIPQIWAPNRYQLVVFEESFPNKMIYRDSLNEAIVRFCYGDLMYKRVAYNPVLCAGTVMGTRNAILLYVCYLNSFRIQCDGYLHIDTFHAAATGRDCAAPVVQLHC